VIKLVVVALGAFVLFFVVFADLALLIQGLRSALASPFGLVADLLGFSVLLVLYLLMILLPGIAVGVVLDRQPRHLGVLHGSPGGAVVSVLKAVYVPVCGVLIVGCSVVLTLLSPTAVQKRFGVESKAYEWGSILAVLVDRQLSAINMRFGESEPNKWPDVSVNVYVPEGAIGLILSGSVAPPPEPLQPSPAFLNALPGDTLPMGGMGRIPDKDFGFSGGDAPVKGLQQALFGALPFLDGLVWVLRRLPFFNLLVPDQVGLGEDDWDRIHRAYELLRSSGELPASSIRLKLGSQVYGEGASQFGTGARHRWEHTWGYLRLFFRKSQFASVSIIPVPRAGDRGWRFSTMFGYRSLEDRSTGRFRQFYLTGPDRFISFDSQQPCHFVGIPPQVPHSVDVNRMKPSLWCLNAPSNSEKGSDGVKERAPGVGILVVTFLEHGDVSAALTRTKISAELGPRDKRKARPGTSPGIGLRALDSNVVLQTIERVNGEFRMVDLDEGETNSALIVVTDGINRMTDTSRTFLAQELRFLLGGGR
jgi:hypothetical protein